MYFPNRDYSQKHLKRSSYFVTKAQQLFDMQKKKYLANSSQITKNVIFFEKNQENRSTRKEKKTWEKMYFLVAIIPKNNLKRSLNQYELSHHYARVNVRY